MSWYAAHLIEYFKLREGVQDSYPVWENVVLIQADNVHEAFKLARQIGEEQYNSPDDSLRLDDKPALKVFSGVRKIVECEIDDPEDLQSPPISGTEITYTKMEVATEEDIQKLMQGYAVTVTLEEVGRNTNTDFSG
ncbi:MAG: DUF4288 domain-containing protein [Chloroflexota bacterium]